MSGKINEVSRQEFGAGKGGVRGRKTDLKEKVKGLLEKGLTAEEAAKVLGKPSRTVRYHAAKLRGIVAAELLPRSVPVAQNGKISTPIYYRVHDWTLSFPLRYVSEGYRRRLKKGNVAVVRGHRVELFPGRLVIRAASGTDFRGSSQDAAFEEGMVFWERVVRLLEDRWKVSLWKRDGQFSVSVEVAEVGNEFAKDLGRRREWVRILDPSSGKAWALVDASTGVPEFEAVDAVRSRDDMGRVLAPFFNDLRAHAGELPPVSRIVSDQAALRQDVRELVAVVRALAELQGAAVPRGAPEPVAEARPWYIE